MQGNQEKSPFRRVNFGGESKEARPESPAAEQQESREEREQVPQEREQAREAIEREAAKMPLPVQAEREIASEAKSMEALDKEGKVERLVQLAQTKGVFFAVRLAKSMDDAYVLDRLHDELAKKGLA